MKLSLLTYNIARDWDLDKIIEVSKKLGFAGIEFRVEQGHNLVTLANQITESIKSVNRLTQTILIRRIER